MSQFNTSKFLPEVFRTATNQRFLGATMDQLVADANNIPINGYIGRKLSPTYKVGDNYVPELANYNKRYQLEAGVVIKDNNGNIISNSNYIDLLYSIANNQGQTANQQRLFESEYYNYDGKFNYDKFVNYYDYYWMPEGPLDSSGNPTSVNVYSTQVPFMETFTVTRNTSEGGYTFTGLGNHPNTQLTLARGGVYSFVVNQPGIDFWIQSAAGVSGTLSNLPTVTSRQVFGVQNNGTDVGTIQFKVPQESAQDFFVNMTSAGTINAAVTNISYNQIQNRLLSTFLTEFPNGLDGVNNNLSGKTFIFYNSVATDAEWTTPAPPTEYAANSTNPLTVGGVIDSAQRVYGWQINLVPVNDNTDYLIQIQPYLPITALEKIFVSSGITYASNQFWLNNNLIYAPVPQITATADYLYYQDSSNPNFVGAIKIVDNSGTPINVTNDILGKVSYVSPNKVIFTNGLKVTFDNITVPSQYANASFYVDGVGTAITLTPVAQLVVPESFGSDIATDPDYITINRSSQDQNAWSRYNRWFHKDVLEATATYNNDSVNYGTSISARRPIIEFDAGLQLFNYGTLAIENVDLFANSAPVSQIGQYGTYTILSLGNTSQAMWNTLAGTSANVYTVGSTFNSRITANGNVAVYGTGVTTTDAFNQIVGQITANVQGVNLTTGTTIIFGNDYDTNVTNKVWQVQTEVVGASNLNNNFINLIDTGLTVTKGTNVLITKGSNAGKSYWYTGSNWNQAQTKSGVNQAPYFDLLDNNGYSFSDTTVYPGSTFAGTKNFGYTVGTGSTVDSYLGFNLAYQNFTNVGDIQFTNYYDSDSFTYTDGTVECSSGYLAINNNSTQKLVNNWVTNVEPSKQYQIFTKFHDDKYILIDGTEYAFVQVDVLPDASATVPYLKVFLNNTLLTNTVDYRLTTYGAYHVVILTQAFSSVAVGDKIDVLVYNSTTTSQLGYYEVPINLDVNPLNESFYNNTVTLGQLRTHYNKLIENTAGNKPLQDSYLKAQGGTLLKQSSPVVYAATFLNDPSVNFVDGITLARKEYTRFKNKFLSLCASMKTLDYSKPVTGVDLVLQTINSVKNNTFPWYYSDMVPQGGTYTTVTYSVQNAKQTTYEINSLFDNTVLSNRAVLVYVNNTQLISGVDYTFSSVSPAVVITSTLNFGDVITIKDYSNTDGNYIPETPTKLGLYPKFVPEKFLDSTYQTPTYVIRGHDGSLTPAFNDFRDEYLLELELRIYNNIKATYTTNEINQFDIKPGKFRNNLYSLTEYNSLLTNTFLQWVGANNVDYTSNKFYSSTNPWTWNYSNSTDRLDGTRLQGSWRAIFDYWYDTTQPHLAPWEMLGFSSMPAWWTTRYGPAPYTSANTTLWEDLEAGYIYNDGNPYNDTRFVRTGLSKYIPVDSAGNLLTPMAISLVATFDSQTVAGDFAVGEQGPAETAWRRSSDFPYAVQLAFALAKPAEYFSTQIDTSLFNRNSVTQQFTTSKNQNLAPGMININGLDVTTNAVTRTSGYINWIGDNIKNLGIDPVAKLANYFQNFNVQLSYKLNGFSDYDLLTVYAEQTSPSAVNASVVIPKENYKIYLNKSVSVSTVIYSAVIVTRTAGGYSVSGYDVNYPYFSILPSVINANNTTITINKLSAKIYQDGATVPFVVPYGTEYTTTQQVVDFLISYQRSLVAQGIQLNTYTTELAETKDFVLSSKEFLYWAQQGWTPNSVIVLNPVSQQINLITNLSVVDEITNAPNGNRILDQNFNPIKVNSFAILRDSIANTVSNNCEIRVLTADSICYARLNLVQYEHVLVFDNVDDFNNIIYVPSSGTRQFRLKVVGNKTGLWTGALGAPGYVYSNPTILNWKTNTDYQAGDIVTFNNGYYTATQRISANTVFDPSQWVQINLSDIQTGLLPNFGHNAQKFINFYDVDRPPAESDLQLYSAGLIGFRERSYLTDLGISIPNQTKFYQGYIKQKGTLNAINALIKSDFDNVQGNISVYEEWAFRVGSYGNQNNVQYNEFVLDQNIFTTNPVALTLTANTYSSGTVIANLALSSNVYNASNLTSTSTSLYDNRTINSYLDDLPYPGYVNLNDIDSTVFNISKIKSVGDLNVGVGNKIWSATTSSNNWNVYRITESGIAAIEIIYSLDDYAKLNFNQNHNLNVGDLFLLTDFDTVYGNYNGIYQVITVINNTSVVVQVDHGTNDTNLNILLHNSPMTGNGTVYKFLAMRVPNIANVAYNVPESGWIANDRVWIDNATPAGWGVYTYNPPWTSNNIVGLTANTVSNNSYFGTSAKISSDSNFVYVAAPAKGNITVYVNVGGNYIANATVSNTNSYFGYSIDTQGNLLAVGGYSGNVNIYTNYGNGSIALTQTLTSSAYAFIGVMYPASIQYGSSVAISGNQKYLFAAAFDSGSVVVYNQAGSNQQYSAYRNNITLPGYSIVYNGSNYVISSTSNVGVIKTTTSGTTFFVGIPNATNTATASGNVYVYSNPIGNGFGLVQTITGQNPHTGNNFGASIDVDSTGGNLFIGAPGAIVNGQVTGIVERYTYNGSSYVYNSTITAPGLPAGNFGQTVRVSGDAAVLAIGATASSGQEATDFDNYATLIDNGATFFVDTIAGSGAVYVYEPLINQSISNDLGVYNFSQELETQVHANDYFGSAIDLNRTTAVVGASGTNNNQGESYIFSNPAAAPAWSLTRSQTPRVDIDSINRTFVYNKTNNNILAVMDYLDPRKGKVLSAFGKDLDYVRTTDPAMYTHSSGTAYSDNHWGPAQVGKVWWDVSQVYYIDYEQDSLSYRLNNWGATVPGSQIAVYQWIESTVPPSEYSSAKGAGVPLYPDDSNYATYGYVDQAGNVHVKYYFWITNSDLIIGNKSNSVNGIISGIENPQSQGIEYSAVLRNDTVALYNTEQYLSGKNSILHLEKKTANTGLLHNEYALVQEGNYQSQIPNGILNKLIDSLAGQDSLGNPVPDTSLSVAQAYGINIKPRQSMFVNPELALTNYITYLNSILIANPITENKLLTILNSGQTIPAANAGLYSLAIDTYSELAYVDTTSLSAGYSVLVASDSNYNGKWTIYTLTSAKTWQFAQVQSYKTNAYWSTVDYYLPTFDRSTSINTTVNTLLDLGKLTLVADTYIKILDTGDGNFAIYYIDSALTKNLVAIGNGTIQISTGTIPPLELRQILLATQTQLLVDDLAPKFNELFFLMIKYVLTEQKNIDWAFKTSFISASQRLRKLSQFPSWIPDNQTFYEEYINEVKPFRTTLREFVIDYIGNDSYSSDITDFDLVPYWDANLSIYRSPNGEQTYDTTTWSSNSSVDSQWYANYKYQIVDFIIENAGSGYTTAPQIIISGGGGTGATAYSTVSNGELVAVFVNTPGTGFTTYPTITVNGVGTGAIVRAVLRNLYDNDNAGHNLIRSISTTMKFDRTSYTVANSFVFWSNVTSANIGQTINANTIIVHNNLLYQLSNAYTIDSSVDFPFANVVALSAGELTNANDRITAFNGNIDLTTVLDGLDYPGVIVDGNTFTGNVYDTNISSKFTDSLGVSPSNIIVDGGKYYDTFSSHAPEEMVPGRMFDSLNFQVYDTANVSYRIFENMSGNLSFYAITSNNTTTLSNALAITANSIYVTNASALPVPNPARAVPGVVFVNGEKITYYTIDTVNNVLGQIRRAVDGTAVFNGNLTYALTVSGNIAVARDTTVILANTGAYGTVTTSTTGNVLSLIGPNESFASGNYLYKFNAGSLLSYKSNVYLITGNIYETTGNIANVASSITKIGYTSGLGTPVPWAANLIINNFSTNLSVVSNSYAISTQVVDSSVQQQIASNIYQANIGSSPVTYCATSNVSFGLRLNGTITANVGDYITQKTTLSGNAAVIVANLQVLGNVTNANVVPVIYKFGQISLDANVLYINGTSTNVSSNGTYVLGMVTTTGNVTLPANTIVKREQAVSTLGNIVLKDAVIEYPYSIGSTQLGNIAPPLFLLWDDYLPVPSGFAP